MEQEKIKAIVEKILVESKSMRKIIDTIDNQLHSSDEAPNNDELLKMTRKAAGAGNNLNKSFLKLKGIKINEEQLKYSQLKVLASTENVKFVSTVADKEASLYVKDIRLARNILESYVSSAITIISICRMHLKGEDTKVTGQLWGIYTFSLIT